MKTKFDLILSNVAPAENADVELLCTQEVEIDLSNAANVDNWYRICGIGEYPARGSGGKRVMQVVDKASLQTVVGVYSSIKEKLLRMVGIGNADVPTYYGHPDDLAFVGTKYGLDNTVYAKVDQMEVRDDGLWAHLDKSNAWEDLNKMGRLRFTPRFGLRWINSAQTKCSPVKLLSLGLVDRPNMADAAYANAKPQNNNQTMNELMLKLLTLIGFSNARIEATEQGGADAISLSEAEAALTAHTETANAAAIEPVQAQLEQVQTETANGYWDLEKAIMKVLGYSDEEIDGLREDGAAAPSIEDIIERLTAKLGSQVEAANAHRAAHAELVIDTAIGNGLITLAERDAEIEALVNAEDFTEASNALEAREPVLPESQTKGLNKRKNEGNLDKKQASSQLVDIANGYVEAKKAKDFTAGYALAKKENPALVEIINEKVI